MICFVSILSGSSIIDDDWQYTTFYPTPKMSTYLFAITVSEFTSTPSSHEHVEIKVRVCWQIQNEFNVFNVSFQWCSMTEISASLYLLTPASGFGMALVLYKI